VYASIVLCFGAVPWVSGGRVGTWAFSGAHREVVASVALAFGAVAAIAVMLWRQQRQLELTGPTRRSECERCAADVCFDCKSPFHLNTVCDDLAAAAVAKWCHQHDGGQCPNCGAFIERSAGCNHMTCRCKHEYCWLCGGKWKENGSRRCDCPHFDGTRKKEYAAALTDTSKLRVRELLYNDTRVIKTFVSLVISGVTLVVVSVFSSDFLPMFQTLGGPKYSHDSTRTLAWKPSDFAWWTIPVHLVLSAAWACTPQGARHVKLDTLLGSISTNSLPLPFGVAAIFAAHALFFIVPLVLPNIVYFATLIPSYPLGLLLLLIEKVPVIGSWIVLPLRPVFRLAVTLIGVTAVGVVDLHVFVFGATIMDFPRPQDLESFPPANNRFLFEFRLWLHVIATATSADNVSYALSELLDKYLHTHSTGGFFRGCRVLTVGSLMISPLFSWVMCGSKWCERRGRFRFPWPKQELVRASWRSAFLLYTYAIVVVPVCLIWSVCALLPDRFAPSWLRTPRGCANDEWSEASPIEFTETMETIFLQVEPFERDELHVELPSASAYFDTVLHFFLCAHICFSVFCVSERQIAAIRRHILEATEKMSAGFSSENVRFVFRHFSKLITCVSVVLGVPGVLWFYSRADDLVAMYIFMSVVMVPPAAVFVIPDSLVALERLARLASQMARKMPSVVVRTTLALLAVVRRAAPIIFRALIFVAPKTSSAFFATINLVTAVGEKISKRNVLIWVIVNLACMVWWWFPKSEQR